MNERTDMMAARRKLIEVSLPLEAINVECATEKSIRHGHPSTLHLWWASRPLDAAIAVLFSQLVDDPSSNEDTYRDEAIRRGVPEARIEGYIEGRITAERERLHELIKRLVKWENINDEALYRTVYSEIQKSTGGSPPTILDPFAGGGSIPLEAQRLGLAAHTSDLNPVAVLINRTLIDIPPRFEGRYPVFPGKAESQLGSWNKARGLAEDVRAYGAWMRDEAEIRIGHLYPDALLRDGSQVPASAWIWARTVVCPNPACLAQVPLLSTSWLSKRKGSEQWLIPTVENGEVHFRITGQGIPSEANKRGQGARFECWVCSSALTPVQVHDQLDVREKPPAKLLSVVAEGTRRRIYLESDVRHRAAAEAAHKQASVIRENDENLKAEANGTFGGNAQGRRYGFFEFHDYFTDRQLVALTTFSDLVAEAHARVLHDAMASGMPMGSPLAQEGNGAMAYADAVVTYLGFAISKMVDRGSSLVSWVIQRESTRNTFARQAISMSWDFVEMNPLLEGTGSFVGACAWTAESIDVTVLHYAIPTVEQANAASRDYANMVVCTDPPYYDNINYSDMSDFFYVWLRRSLRAIYPKELSTILVPKAEELVANAYRHGGKAAAQVFFETGFTHVFDRMRAQAPADFPTTVFYAFKQAETGSAGTASTGWQTLLEGMIHAGWTITATWPIRSERPDRTIGLGSNALASSIVLALRPRDDELAEVTSRRGFLAALKAELPEALRDLRQGSIAPVDLAQAAIGPGMGVFSRYSRVVEADGTSLTVRTALALINNALDEVLSEQEGDFDSDTRFCVKWFTQFGWTKRKAGEADTLARAVNTSTAKLERAGSFWARSGEARLLPPGELNASWDPAADLQVSVWEATMHLAKCLDELGAPAAMTLMTAIGQKMDLSTVQELAYLLYSICERLGRPKDALLFNGLGTSWADLSTGARREETAAPAGIQSTFDFDAEDE